MGNTTIRSKLVVMVSIITIIIAIPGKLAAVSRPDESDVLHVPIGSLGKCPTHNITSEYYQITVLGSITQLVGGCAYIQHNPNEVKRQSFSLWISKFKSHAQRCREKNYIDMEHYHFNCLIKPPSSLDDFNKRYTSVSLYPVITSHQKDAHKIHSKCAMYDVIKGDATMFRMAISGNSSCAGLLDLLTYPNLMNLNHEGEYMLLRFNRYQYPMTYLSKRLY
ncbi:hypothetical protein ACI65C_006294 [Semiaphis heraclei]